MKYRKKPLEVEAFELIDLSYGTVSKALEFMGQTAPTTKAHMGDESAFDEYMKIVWKQNGIKIVTLEGTMLASVGDYIIKGVHGEFYPCKPDIFDLTYEKVED